MSASPAADRDAEHVSEGQEDYTKFLQPFQRKPKRFKKDGTPYKPRKGWGPYRSVPNERAAAFNLQLDVQALQQEIQNLTALRNVLHTSALLQRSALEESACQLVTEYFHVFRRGRSTDDQDQRALVHTMMHEAVDVGNGLHGPEVVLEQMERYSSYMRFIHLAGEIDNVVKADDSVLVAARFSLTLQVLRSTIEMVLPQSMTNACLVAQLVGKELLVEGRAMFLFNAAGKCFKLDVDADSVTAFMRLLNDLDAVGALLARALITDNALIGVVREPSEEMMATKCQPGVDSVTTPEYSQSKCCRPQTAAMYTPPRCISPCSERIACQEAVGKIVEAYFSAFANGREEYAETQSDFILQRLAIQDEIADRLQRRWRALSECFEVLCFQEQGELRIECGNSCNRCLVESTAAYSLRITFYTIQSVFPHLLSYLPLLNALVGHLIVVPSRILFSVDKRAGVIRRIQESMDFASAMAQLLPDHRECSFVISQALLAQDGVDWSRLEVRSARQPPQLWASQLGTSLNR